jgi:Amt family ammonium transporter
MRLLTSFYGGKGGGRLLALLGAVLLAAPTLRAQPDTNSEIPGPGAIAQKITNTPATNAPATNAPPVEPAPAVIPALPSVRAAIPPPATPPNLTEAPAPDTIPKLMPAWNQAGSVLGAVMALGSLAGFLLYYGGLGRAKNSGHTATLLLVGAVAALLGFWVGGFALQSGGLGSGFAALMQPVERSTASALNHEIGFHNWGIMGSAGFFLQTDEASRNNVAALFLLQGAMMLIAITAALGAALERVRIVSAGICAYLTGVLIYPLFANWVWGGGWLAELGRDAQMGNGFVDPGGAAVVHETAGVLALVLATVLGPRHGRFGRESTARALPGHNVPLLVLGSVVLLLSWMATNGFIFAALPVDPADPTATSCAALAVINTLLAAVGGVTISLIQAAAQRTGPEPARLCRGLLGGAVASCGCAGWIDPWAAFVIGALAGVLVQFTVEQMERRRIDDPVGAVAVHGTAGAWGVIATGLFANASGGGGINGVRTPVRGFFYGGALHQVIPQFIGAAACLIVVYLLGYGLATLIHAILGTRAPLAEEQKGLDETETGALGYQGDVEPEE